MKIAVDISQSVYGTGVSIYTRFLFKEILNLDKENEYLFWGGSLRKIDRLKEIGSEILLNSNKSKFKYLPISPKIADIVFNKIHFLPIEALLGKMDVCHSSDWTQPKSSAFNVTTIHDLAPIFVPEYTPKEIINVHKLRLKRIINEVDRIIVPSNFTKNELLRIGYPEDKVRVIYEAPGDIFKPQSEKSIRDLKKKYRISGDYILAVGVGKRKNTQGIIRGYELSKAGKDITLIIAGYPEKEDENKRGVRYVGLLKDHELATFYSGAKALVFPSFYEGFGLPILQAFACRCPVVTSNQSSMSEIAGDAAVLVDPKDVNSIADGIKKAISAPKTYILKGEKRVSEFSWVKAAKETLDVYRESKN